MASTYELTTLQALPMTYEVACSITPSAEYAGVQIVRVASSDPLYYAVGPRDALLCLKYDLEKRRHGR